jgi:hypothetical protein
VGRIEMPSMVSFWANAASRSFDAGNALEWGRVRLPVDDDHFGFCCDNEQITLEVERVDGLATGTECVRRA